MKKNPNEARSEIDAMGNWNDSVLQITADFRELFMTIPYGAPGEQELLDILTRLEFANRHMTRQLEDMRGGHVIH